MKVAIDVTRAIIETAGIGRYTFELTHALLDNAPDYDFLIYSTHFNNSEEKNKKFLSFKRENVKLKRLHIPGKCKEFIWGLPINFLGKFIENSDIIFAPSFFEAIAKSKIPQVVTIHDMSTFIFPQQRGAKMSKYLCRRTAAVARRAYKIVAVSESTKNDLVKFLKLPEEKIQMIYPGVNQLSAPSAKLPFDLKQGEYILCVGTVEPRKNLQGLFKAYSLLPESLQNTYKLVVCGGKGWNDSQIYELAQPLVKKGQLVFTGFVSDRDLSKLYEDALLFIYPSLYEGFGFPIAEAMSFGLPVISSNISSMPEVAGDAGLLIDPNSPEDIAKAVERVINDNDLRKKMAFKSLRQCQKFSWRSSARELRDLLDEAIQVDNANA